MMRPRFAKFAWMMLAGSTVVTMAACGGATDDSNAEPLEQAASALVSNTINGPIIGECTTTVTMDKVVDASGATIVRAVCTETCKRTGKLTITSINLTQRTPTSVTALIGPQVVNGTKNSLTAELPYTPGGTYQAGCSAGWQNDNKGPNYVTPFIFETAL